MRNLAYGLVAALAFGLPACSSSTAKRELEPLPGVTSLTTLPGATTLPGLSVATPTTVPGQTVPSVTVVLPTIAPTVPVPSTPAGPIWTFGDFRALPQLGTEPVRGSGCGADGSVGDTIPDGWWLGIVTGGGPGTIEFDLVCGYYGTAAQPLIDECLASPATATCLDFFDKSFWPVNRNSKSRTVPTAGELKIETLGELCGVGIEIRTAGITAELNWLRIDHGKAVYLRRGCGGE